MLLGAVLTWKMSAIEVRALAWAWATQQVRDHLNLAVLLRSQGRLVVEGETLGHLAARIMLRRMLETVIAFQSIAQLRQTYTDHGAEIITGQTATQVLMCIGDTATARWGVDLFGTVEVENQRPTERWATTRTVAAAWHQPRAQDAAGRSC